MTGPFDDGPRLCGARWLARLAGFRCRCCRPAGHAGAHDCMCGEQSGQQDGPDAPATPDPSH